MKPLRKISFFALFLALNAELYSASAQERALLKFYAKNYHAIRPAYLHTIVSSTEKWASLLCLSGHVDTLLSMAHRESEMNQLADDISITGKNRNSVGIYQTRKDYRASLRKFWLVRGYRLGSDDSVDTQCAFGVAEFYVHLQRSHGIVWTGVRRYNGAGTMARAYTRKVMTSRRIIFKHAYEVGESVPVGCSAKTKRRK